MEHQDHLKTIQSKDINKCVNDLPVLQADINDRVPSIQGDIKDSRNGYVHIKPNRKSDLTEGAQYTQEHQSDVHRIANAAGFGTDDYDKHLEKLHKNVPAFVPTGKQTNAVDNYIYDVLKRGRPSGETVAHIHDVMHTENPEMDYADNQNNQKYLMSKYGNFLTKHAADKQSFFYPHESSYTREELNSIPKNFKPVGLRLVSHYPSGHLYEYHPTEGLKFIAHSHDARYNKDIEQPNEFDDLSKKLHDQYEQFESPHVTQYSADSSAMNRYHFLKHLDQLDSSQEHILGVHLDRIKDTSKGVSDYIKSIHHPTHLPDFHVYTGLFGANNPHTQATHKDEHGNLLFHVPAFTSTSLNMSVAQDFAKKKVDDSLNREFTDVLKIKLPGGYHHGAFIKPQSEFQEEEEYLLDRGHNLKLHPEPDYHVHNNRIVRVWNAEPHHKDVDLSKPFHDLSRPEKLDALLHPDVTEKHIGSAQYDADTSVRAAAAKHPKATQLGLEFLAKDRSPKVRQAAMLNPNLSHKQMYESLSDVPSAKTLAERSDVPAHIVNALVNHSDNDVKATVAKRHDLSSDEIGHLITHGDDPVMESLAGNKSLHPDLLHEFRNHKNRNVRAALANNPSANEITLRNMQYDESGSVANAASDNLKRKAGVKKG